MILKAPLTSGQEQKLRQLNDAFTVDRQLETLTGLSLRMAVILPLTFEQQPLAISAVDRMHDPGLPPPAVPPRSRDPPNQWFSRLSFDSPNRPASSATYKNWLRVLFLSMTKLESDRVRVANHRTKAREANIRAQTLWLPAELRGLLPAVTRLPPVQRWRDKGDSVHQRPHTRQRGVAAWRVSSRQTTRASRF